MFELNLLHLSIADLFELNLLYLNIVDYKKKMNI
jgi:hypothetical protein